MRTNRIALKIHYNFNERGKLLFKTHYKMNEYLVWLPEDMYIHVVFVICSRRAFE